VACANLAGDGVGARDAGSRGDTGEGPGSAGELAAATITISISIIIIIIITLTSHPSPLMSSDPPRPSLMQHIQSSLGTAGLGLDLPLRGGQGQGALGPRGVSALVLKRQTFWRQTKPLENHTCVPPHGQLRTIRALFVLFVSSSQRQLDSYSLSLGSGR
jgi:hypothetical protein